MSPSLCSLAVFLFGTIVTALPIPPSAPSTPEQWTIPRLDMHMMSRSTFLPGNPPWPEAARFPTTIDFDVQMPDLSASCKAEWVNGTLPDPDSLTDCAYKDGTSAARVSFGMEEWKGLGDRRKELSFSLRVFRVAEAVGKQTITTAETAITANDPKEPSSYLTCLQGAPLDGLRCHLGGAMSVRKPLVLDAQTNMESDMDALVTASQPNHI